MGYGIMRVEKRHRSAIRGIQTENNRSQADHRHTFVRSDIDWRRTANNIYLKHTDDWNQAVTDTIAWYGAKERKDSVVMLDGLYTASPEWFKNKSDEEIREYFHKCLEYHQKTYCEDNKDLIVNAVIHFDEATPHMHVASIPLVDMNKDKARLNAKAIMGNKQAYSKRQTSFYEDVAKQFGLDRGETHKSKRKHLDTLDYKFNEAVKEEVQAFLRDEVEFYAKAHGIRDVEAFKEQIQEGYEQLYDDIEDIDR